MSSPLVTAPRELNAREHVAGRVLRAALKNFALSDHPSVRASCLLRAITAVIAANSGDGDYLVALSQGIGIEIDGVTLRHIMEGRLHAVHLAKEFSRGTTMLALVDLLTATLGAYGYRAIADAVRLVTTEDRALISSYPRPWDDELAARIATALTCAGIV